MNIYPIFDRMLTRADKEQLLGQRGMMIWFTGLSGSGKSTIAIALERELQRRRLLCGQRTVGKPHVPPGRQPEQLPGVEICVRTARRRQPRCVPIERRCHVMPAARSTMPTCAHHQAPSSAKAQ